jgi:hypothetical protein
MFMNFCQYEMEKKIDECSNASSDQWIDKFDDEDHGGRKNPFLNIYHSFFNVKLLMKNHKQPEDFSEVKLNIDQVS